MLLYVCAAAFGAPTVVQIDSDIVGKKHVLTTSELNASHIQLSEIVVAQDYTLGFLSTKALAFSASLFNLHNSTANSTKSLTVVPGALFMVLVCPTTSRINSTKYAIRDKKIRLVAKKEKVVAFKRQVRLIII